MPRPPSKKHLRRIEQERAERGVSGRSYIGTGYPGPESTVEQRVAWCCHLMSTGEWSGYATRAELAPIWGVDEKTVQNYAQEAGRRMKLDGEMLDQQKIAHAAFCRRIQQQAIEERSQVTGLPDYGAALKATELAAKFQGIEVDAKRVELTGKGGGAIAISLDDIDAALKTAAANAAGGDGDGGTSTPAS